MKNTLKERINALVAKANTVHDVIQKAEDIDWNQADKDENEILAELDAIDKAAGPGLAVGRVLSFGVADGRASYIITKVRKNDVVVEWVPILDGYWSSAVGLNADRTQNVVLRSTAEAYCRIGI